MPNQSPCGAIDSLWVCHNGRHELKQIKDKSVQQQMRKLSNTPIMVKDSKGKFYAEGYHDLKRVIDQLEKQRARVNRKFVLNNLVRHLRDNDTLPAICFVFSKNTWSQCPRVDDRRIGAR